MRCIIMAMTDLEKMSVKYPDHRAVLLREQEIQRRHGHLEIDAVPAVMVAERTRAPDHAR